MLFPWYDDEPDVGFSQLPSDRYLDALVAGEKPKDDPFGFRELARKARADEIAAKESERKSSRAFTLTESAAKGEDAPPKE